MTRARKVTRTGFSLLEVMIATAILAGSAMVLMSLISMGTKYGSRAEDRIAALVQAQSILDETVARMAFEEMRDQQSGELSAETESSRTRRSYRISLEPFPWSDASREAAAMSADAIKNEITLDAVTQGNRSLRPASLVRIQVELFEGSPSQWNAEPQPLVALTRIVRQYTQPPAAEREPVSDTRSSNRSLPQSLPLPRPANRPSSQRVPS